MQRHPFIISATIAGLSIVGTIAAVQPVKAIENSDGFLLPFFLNREEWHSF
jgi:hypothetical protein